MPIVLEIPCQASPPRPIVARITRPSGGMPAFWPTNPRGVNMIICIARRKFIALAGASFAWPLVAHAQQLEKIPTVGVLWHAGSAKEEASNFTALIEGFKNVGYVEGRNIRFEHRFPNELPERFRSMAAELASLNVDVLVVVGNNAAPYAKDATTTIPVVFILVGDPIGLKLVDSFARPQGNVTGLSNFTAELIPKRLQLLKEIVPGLSRVALLANMNAKISRLYMDLSHAAAAQLQFTIQTFEVRSPNELEAAFDAMARADLQALTANADGLPFTQRAVIAKFALSHRLHSPFGLERLWRRGRLCPMAL